MLTMYSSENIQDNPWASYFGDYDVENLENMGLPDDAQDTEHARISSKDIDKLFYFTSPMREELIFVQCRHCKSYIMPHSIKNHIDRRHTGCIQYEKDPEFSIFRKVKKSEFKPPPLPTIRTPAPNSRASFTFRVPYAPSSRVPTSCSVTASSVGSKSPQLAEQFLGWPNSPHGAYQLSSAKAANIVRVKTENSKVKVVIPGCKSKAGPAVSILAKNLALRKKVQELAKPPLPVVKQEPFNQTFSFSATPNIIPPSPTHKFLTPFVPDSPCTSSQDMPSTSYAKPSTSRELLPCQTVSSSDTKFAVYTPVRQPSSTDTSSNVEDTKGKPVLEKLVLRRVLQTDQKASADGRHSVQGLRGVTKNKKEPYFMVVKSKDRQQNLMAASETIKKHADVVQQQKDKVEQKMKKLESVRNKLINKLFLELQNVKKKLDQCNFSRREIERELLAVKADLEETKRNTDFQNAALQKQNAKFESEIQMLRQRNQELTNSLQQAQMYSELGNHSWNYGDSHMSKQFQAIEEQKLELQRRIEELEAESRELKHSSNIERGRFDAKLRQYLIIITELKRRLDEQVAKSEELKLQRDFYEKHLPPEICFQVKSQMATYQNQSEVYDVYPGMLTPQATPPITSPAIPLAETLITDIQNINYITFQSMLSPENTEVLQQQQQEGMEEEIS